MNDLDRVTVVGPEILEAIKNFERFAGGLPQLSLQLTHTLHAGTYCRTLALPKGTVITGAQIKIPTVLIVSGNVNVMDSTRSGVTHLDGYNVLEGAAGRKCVFVANSDAHLTMVFATDAKTVEEAEKRFTDEYEKLKG